jgi:hypothetical protein
MTVNKISVAPEYLSFYIAGVDDITVPLDHDGIGIVASGQCINVSCLYWNEGDTTITLGPFEELPTRAERPRFDGSLDTPEYRVVLSDANMPEILSMEVPGTKTRVRIWMNRPQYPDDVVIALG